LLDRSWITRRRPEFGEPRFDASNAEFSTQQSAMIPFSTTARTPSWPSRKSRSVGWKADSRFCPVRLPWSRRGFVCSTAARSGSGPCSPPGSDWRRTRRTLPSPRRASWLDQIAESHARIQAGHGRGKLVITV
jgi:hypothetical protein